MQKEEIPRLTVYIDIKSPYAFVALQPTLNLEQYSNHLFDWKPLTLDIPSYLGSAKKNDSGELIENNRSTSQWSSVKYAYRDARRYAKRQGKMLFGTQKIWDSSIANMGISWVSMKDRSRLPDYLNNVFTPFWQKNLDIEDVEVVSRVLSSSNVTTRGFKDYVSGEGRKQHDSLQDSFHQRGIFGVPTYEFPDEFLFGREHLPYIKWRLTGKKDKTPDIAYIL
ncbi:DsbA family protein [Gammaproteobacteria bacterium]|nr:DsbA family protein [Gammaproteobacteria bacterium]